MSDLDDIAAALAHQIDSIEGITGLAAWPDSVDPPVAIVDGPTEAVYELTFGNSAVEYLYDIDIVVDISARNGWPQAQSELRPFLSSRGSQSIPQALLAGGTYGGLIDALWITGSRLHGQLDINDNPNRYGATVNIRLRTPRP